MSNISDAMIRTIEKASFDGKNMLFRWADSTLLSSGYDMSCKSYLIELLVDDANLRSHVTNHGYKGLRMVWVRHGINFEPYCFAAGGALNG